MEEQEMVAKVEVLGKQLIALDFGAASVEDVREFRLGIEHLLYEIETEKQGWHEDLEVEFEGHEVWEFAYAMELVQAVHVLQASWKPVPQELYDTAWDRMKTAWDLQDDPSTELAWCFVHAMEEIFHCLDDIDEDHYAFPMLRDAMEFTQA